MHHMTLHKKRPLHVPEARREGACQTIITDIEESKVHQVADRYRQGSSELVAEEIKVGQAHQSGTRAL